MSRLAVAALALVLAGCEPMFTQTGPILKPLKPNCPVRILTVAPSAPFTELATISGLVGSYRYPDRDRLQSYVCQAGGNAAIIRWCEDGICWATIIKLNQPEVGSEEAAAGCQYDTQCKGDRLCVEGRCTDPPK
jgi:hypothetical protein